MVGQAPLRLCVALIGAFAGDAEQQIKVHFKTFFKTLLVDVLTISGAVVRTGPFWRCYCICGQVVSAGQVYSLSCMIARGGGHSLSAWR